MPPEPRVSGSTFAKLFALADYREQAELLNEAGRTLRRVCDNEYYAELQLCRVTDELDDHGRWLVGRLHKFIDRSAT
jgi:hypothetical protein